MKVFRVFSSLLLGLSMIAHAETPKTCPDIANIQTEGLDQFTVSNDVYTIFHQSHYHTSYPWVFSISPIKATTSDDAIDEANTLLETIKEWPIPTPKDDGQNISCAYALEESNNIHAIAVLSEPRL